MSEPKVSDHPIHAEPRTAAAPDVLDRPAHAGSLRRLRARALQLPLRFSTGPGLGARLRFQIG